jgi:hypothetical protein
MTTQTYNQYIDAENAVVRRPEGDNWTDSPYGDGVWRSYWFYASLLVVSALDAATYDWLQTEHHVDASLAGRFLTHFRDHCLSDDSWQLPKHPEQAFSRDQLVPMLYLLAAVSAHASEFEGVGGDILRSLGRLEEHGRGVSSEARGSIGHNISYLIDVLSDEQRYNMVYRTSDMTVCGRPPFSTRKNQEEPADLLQGPILPRSQGITCLSSSTNPCRVARCSEYPSSWIHCQISARCSMLPSVSLQCIAWGKDDHDVQDWRANFKVHADDGWEPAFRLVAGRSINNAEIEAYRSAFVTPARTMTLLWLSGREASEMRYSISRSRVCLVNG